MISYRFGKVDKENPDKLPETKAFFAGVGVLSYTSELYEFDMNVIIKFPKTGEKECKVFVPEMGVYINIKDAMEIFNIKMLMLKELWAVLKLYNPLESDVPLNEFVQKTIHSRQQKK